MNVSVAHMTVAPRFVFLWQSFSKTAAAIAAHHHTVSREPSPRSPASGPFPIPPAQATETLLARTERIFVSRIRDPASILPEGRPAAAPRLRRITTPPLRILARGTLSAGPATGAGDATQFAHTTAHPFRGGRLRFSSAAVQTRAETTLRRTAEVLRTTVVQRVHRLLSQNDGAPRSAAEEPPASARRAPAEDHRPRVFAAPRALGTAAPPDPAAPWRDPTERHFRADPPPAPTPDSAAPPPPRAPQAHRVPEIDIAKLDRVLWQRFEKRLRIEQERTGRG